jgi:general secretion pathway protein H
MRSRRGVTLLEMMVVVAIIAVMAGLSYPFAASGLDSLRMSTAADSVVAFLNGAVERANRRQVAVEVMVDPGANLLVLHSTEPGFERRLEMPAGVTIESILPASLEGKVARRFLIYPGGTVPRIGILLANGRGQRRLVRVDPVTGAPQIERNPEGPPA